MGHPRRLGRPTRCGTSHAAGLSQFGWVVPVWLGCPSLAGVSQLRAIPPWGRLSHFTGSSQPCMGRPTRPGCPSLAGLSLWLGCPTFDWVVPAAGHPTLARAVPFHWVIPVPLELLNVKGHSLFEMFNTNNITTIRTVTNNNLTLELLNVKDFPLVAGNQRFQRLVQLL